MRSDDPAIEQLEADLRKSQFEKWDVETFLAEHHQAKAKALLRPKNKWAGRWVAAKEVSDLFFIFAGRVATASALGYWILLGGPPFFA